jgi:hypothetical protein
MGPKNEFVSTSRSGPQEKVIPENGRKGTNMARKAEISKDHPHKGKFDPRYGLLKQKATNKRDSVKRRSFPLDQQVKEIKIVKGCSEKKTTNPGCNDQKRKEGWTNRGGTDEKSIRKNQSIWEVLKSNESRANIKHEKVNLKNVSKDEFKEVKMPKYHKRKNRIVVDTNKTKSNIDNVNKSNVEDHLDDSDLDSYTRPLFESIKSINFILKDMKKMEANYSNAYEMKSKNCYSTDDDFRRFVKAPSRREKNVLMEITIKSRQDGLFMEGGLPLALALCHFKYKFVFFLCVIVRGGREKGASAECVTDLD